jgi:hypothetical protein
VLALDLLSDGRLKKGVVVDLFLRRRLQFLAPVAGELLGVGSRSAERWEVKKGRRGRFVSAKEATVPSAGGGELLGVGCRFAERWEVKMGRRGRFVSSGCPAAWLSEWCGGVRPRWLALVGSVVAGRS